jgi:hypothetical protein
VGNDTNNGEFTCAPNEWFSRVTWLATRLERALPRQREPTRLAEPGAGRAC